MRKTDPFADGSKNIHQIDDIEPPGPDKIFNLFATLANGERIQRAFKLTRSSEDGQSTPNFSYDQKLIKKRRRLTGIRHNYEYARKNLSAQKQHFHLVIQNESLTSVSDNLGIVVAGYSLKNSAEAKYFPASIRQRDKSNVLFSIAGLEEATPYKVYFYFYDLRNAQSPRLVGGHGLPYYFVTDGTQTQMARRRTEIVMKGLAEWNAWETNSYDRSKAYDTNRSAGWCYQFYNWAVSDYYRGHGYGQGSWSRNGAYHTGQDVLRIAQSGDIRGDMVGTSGHRAMLLSYDTHLKTFWTLEGNFNNRVEIWKRRPGTFWQGRLLDQNAR